MTHSGDRAESANLEAGRFDHYSRTWASWQHGAFLKQAVSCAMARATYAAMARKAKTDLVNELGTKAAFNACCG